jgi:hypothetical protein
MPPSVEPPHEIERLRRENEHLRKQNAEQVKRIADLERQLALQQNSTTTSKPLSSDGLAGRQQVHVLAYLTAAIRRHRRRQAVASLLAKRLTLGLLQGAAFRSASCPTPIQELVEGLRRRYV